MKKRNRAPQRFSLKERFEYFTDKTQGKCWKWNGAKTILGYGTTIYEGKLYMAHRLSFEFYKKIIPVGYVIDHLCRNPNCVNPDHLDAVTHRENLRRGVFPNRAKNQCPKGHEYTNENVYLKGPYGDWRECKICRRNNSRRYKLANIDKVREAGREYMRKKLMIKKDNFRI